MPPQAGDFPYTGFLATSLLAFVTLVACLLTIWMAFKEGKFNVFTYLVLLLYFWGTLCRCFMFFCFFGPLKWKMEGFLLLFPQLCSLLATYMHTNSWVFDILLLQSPGASMHYITN